MPRAAMATFHGKLANQPVHPSNVIPHTMAWSSRDHNTTTSAAVCCVAVAA